MTITSKQLLLIAEQELKQHADQPVISARSINVRDDHFLTATLEVTTSLGTLYALPAACRMYTWPMEELRDSVCSDLGHWERYGHDYEEYEDDDEQYEYIAYCRTVAGHEQYRVYDVADDYDDTEELVEQLVHDYMKQHLRYVRATGIVIREGQRLLLTSLKSSACVTVIDPEGRVSPPVPVQAGDSMSLDYPEGTEVYFCGDSRARGAPIVVISNSGGGGSITTHVDTIGPVIPRESGASAVAAAIEMVAMLRAWEKRVEMGGYYDSMEIEDCGTVRAVLTSMAGGDVPLTVLEESPAFRHLPHATRTALGNFYRTTRSMPDPSGVVRALSRMLREQFFTFSPSTLQGCMLTVVAQHRDTVAATSEEAERTPVGSMDHAAESLSEVMRTLTTPTSGTISVRRTRPVRQPPRPVAWPPTLGEGRTSHSQSDLF